MIHVFLAEKPNLDPEGYSVIWPVGEFGWESAAGPQGIVFLPLCTTGYINSCWSVNRVLRMAARLI